jgi:Flp pilus assembly protein TadD
MVKHAAAVLALVLFAGCSGQRRTIRIPDSVMTNPKTKSDAKSARSEDYVIKMSDGKHTFQVQFPVPATGAISTAFPLKQRGTDRGLDMEAPDAPQTEADAEIIESKKASGERVAEPEPGGQAKTKSYLTAMARVKDLYKQRQYELALIDLTKLDRDYPDDERILEMKGTLYWKLHRNKQAREAWERVLAIDPNNAMVAQALEQLSQDGE